METGKSKLDTWLERVKMIAEIIAIPVAAWWAFTRFVEGEKPSLEYRADVHGELNWYPRSSTDCLAEYRVTVKNIGKTSFEVTKANVRAWIVDDFGPFKGIAYINPHALVENKAPIVNEEIRNDLIGHYAPDVGDAVGFNFGVQRKRGAVVIFWFRAQSAQAEERSPWEDYRWDYACGKPPGDEKTVPLTKGKTVSDRAKAK
jgi:hypothetical protein